MTVALSPSIRARIWKASNDPNDRRFLAPIFGAMPESFAHKLFAEYERRAATNGLGEANLYALDLKEKWVPELFADTDLPFQASDDDIADEAERAAKRAADCLRRNPSEEAALAALGRLAKRYRVSLPARKNFAGIAARMTEWAWWRKTLRRRFREVENAAIRAGLVHRLAAPFATDEACRRQQRHADKIARLLEAHEAINETTGEVVCLAEIAERSLANPANRRIEMMVRVRGLEDLADSLGYEGHFVTITCPSRMHAREWKSGNQNPRYDNTSPRSAQAYLARLWNTTTRKLKRDGIGAFGVRVVEPHHDATPHWHMLVFVHPDQAGSLLATLHDYALRDSPEERGAEQHRFTVERIDPTKGSAASYVAKYVSKNIDGHGVGTDEETDRPATDTAKRVTVWARQHGIRQFQFFGVGPVTPYRELFRLQNLNDSLEALVGAAHRAAKANDYGAFLRALRLVGTRLGNHTEEKESARYPGETVKRVRGVLIDGADWLQTRFDDWTIRRKPEQLRAVHLPPWTRFNNSARHDSIGKFWGRSEIHGNCGDAMGDDSAWPEMCSQDRHETRAPVRAVSIKEKREAGAVQTTPETLSMLLSNIEHYRSEGKHDIADAVEDAMREALRHRGELFELVRGGQKEETPESRTATN